MTTFDMNNAVEIAKMDIYAIYLRKSRADMEAEKLGEGETLARHKKILTELAARKGLYIGKIYQEIVSGETIEDRPEIQKLIKDCYDGKYKGILIVEVTRLSRGNQGDAQKIMDCLKYSNMNNGLLVVTPTKTYDVAHNTDDEEYMEFELFMSRREHKMIGKRMLRGRHQSVVEGNYISSYRPYGYNIIKTRTSRTLIPNKDEAPIVKMIFDMAVNQNMSSGKIARYLTMSGIPTYYGEREWNPDTIKAILTNETYTGKVRWNYTMKIKTMVDGNLISKRTNASETDHYMLYDGKHKEHALVDEDTFRKASTKYYHDKTKTNLRLSNPLAGLLFCKSCGRAMAYQSYAHRKGSVSPRYCHKTSTSCKIKSVITQDVIDAVVYALKLYIDNFEIKMDSLPDVDENTVYDQIEVIEREIRKTERILSKLFDSWELEQISDNEFVQRKAIHNEKIENLKNRIEEIENSIPEKENYENIIYHLSDALNKVTDDTLEAGIKNEYLKRVFSKIEFSRENNHEFILDINLR